MSIPDYYKILEVSSSATNAEIKAAYRRLAKLFHPDKNSGNLASEEKFKQIKDAYENLINPLRRKKYDDKRNRSFISSRPTGGFQKKQTAKKNYNFTEEEAKRRKYYQENYKTTSYTEPKKEKQGGVSTELKYILLSVPLAVALLLLVVRLYENPKKKNKISADTSLRMVSEIHTPESPYEGVLGKNSFDTASHSIIKIVNRSGYDALVFLKNDAGKIIRHHFIENKYELYFEHIHPSSYTLYYWLGNGFSNKNYLFNDISGNYAKSVCLDSINNFIEIKKDVPDTFIFPLTATTPLRLDTVLLKRIFRKPS